MKWPLRRTGDPIPGHGSAWTGFVVGIAASIAANVLHAMEGAWTYPELVGAAFWPTALLISVEVLTRVAWPNGWQWIVTRFAGVVVVAFVAAALSYLHMRSLLLSWGEGVFQATIGPAAVDGLMLISATALLAVSRTKHPAPTPVLEQPGMLAGLDAAPADMVAKIKAAVLADLPLLPELPQPLTAAKTTALRIPLSGARRPGRRTGALAGRRRAAAALEATPAPPRVLSPTDLPDGTLLLPSGVTYTPPEKASALNGHTRPPTSTEQVPEKPAPKASRRKPAKRAGALDQASYDKAFRFWQSQSDAGSPPSAQQLADVIGRSKATGGRLLQEFREKVSV